MPTFSASCRLLAFGFCPAGSSGGDDKAEPQQSFMKSNLLKADRTVACLRLQCFLRFLCTSPSSPLLICEPEKETRNQLASAMNALLFECVAEYKDTCCSCNWASLPHSLILALILSLCFILFCVTISKCQQGPGKFIGN